MAWWAEWWHRGWCASAAGLLALAAVANAAADATNVCAVAITSNTVPAWMELSMLETNPVAWADLADIWRRNPDADASPVENLTLPVEHYDDGRIRALLRAGKADVSTAGLVWSWNVVVDFFDPAGAPDGRVQAESCLYDRNARRGYCPAGVTLTRTNVVITGTGLYWTMSTQRMQILSNPVVRLQQRMKLPEGGSPK